MTTAINSGIGSTAIQLRERYSQARQLTLKIVDRLSAEDQMLQSMADASPTKWHLAHTTWFFETFILSPFVREYEPLNSRYKFVFNSYYKQLGAHPYRGARGLMSRPTLEDVLSYRSYVDETMMKAVENLQPEALALLELGINHEQQHDELILTDIKHGLWSGPMHSETESAINKGKSAIPVEWISFPGGVSKIGFEGDAFSFDNERPRHDVLVQPFSLASRCVTNEEFAAFIRDRGYERPELWLSEGWDTVCNQQWRAPIYWRKAEGDSASGWEEFAEDGYRPVESDEPVCHISYFEADAFARWSGKRLPTEQEWEIAASQHQTRGTLLEDFVFHPRPAIGTGLQQMIGDVWEWTASPYVPYPGFSPEPGLIGEYNGKFMCNQMILRGGSCATPESHIRTSYRNFFPASARWQFAGLRLAH